MALLLTIVLLGIVSCNALLFGNSNVKKTKPVNVALYGRTTQSSLYANPNEGFFGYGMNAIDGNMNPNYYRGSCFHSDSDFSPWWRLNLVQPLKIYRITITNRGDCCERRLDGAEILVGNSMDNDGNDNPVCGKIATLAPGSSVTFDCRNMEGQYVNVIIRGRKEFLHFCELQVFVLPENLDDYFLKVII